MTPGFKQQSVIFPYFNRESTLLVQTIHCVTFILLFPQINKVYLGNDSQGRGCGIFVEEIEVHCADEDPVIFPCRCWLAEDEGDGKTARILVPGETIQPQLDSKPNL